MNWQKQELVYLQDNFPNTSDAELSKELRKSPNSIRIKASRLKVRKNSAVYRENLQLTPIEEQVIVGSLMGDLHCRLAHSAKNPCLEGGHGPAQKEYMEWKLKILSRLKCRVSKSKDGAFHFASKNFPCLHTYLQLFYPNKIKTVTREILDKIDRLGLLIWYLDDGSYSKRNKGSSLFTNCFTHEEHLLIKNWFQDKWDINPSIYQFINANGKTVYYLYFIIKETNKLYSLFADFEVPECMKYKISSPIHTYQHPSLELS